MAKTFPPIFTEYMNAAKAAWMGELPQMPGECQNCGGHRFMTIFVAKEGPYRHASSDHSKISKFYNGHWWIGQGYSAACPVCEGRGEIVNTPDPVFVEMPEQTRAALAYLAKRLKSPQQKHRRTADEDVQAHARADAIKAELATMPQPAGDGPDNWWNQDEHEVMWNTGEEG